MSSPDNCSFNASDTEVPTPSCLLLPRHGSFKSQSSTCIFTVDATTNPQYSLLNDPIRGTKRTTELPIDRRYSHLDTGDGQPIDHVRCHVFNPRAAIEELESQKMEQLSPLGRKVIAFVAITLAFLCVLLVGVTLRLGPVIDEIVRKENEDIYRAMSAGPTPAPSAANNVANGTSTSVQPG